ncbi:MULTISPECIES: hypothetical protein [unclassified Clostridium]|uniref:hypothetical protein n=1 Tax=unclassified Clostridium TaxID=2614128 RepID=UPI00207B0A10|nr:MULTISPECIES: hypothetical protein [unclassified Clostridium]
MRKKIIFIVSIVILLSIGLVTWINVSKTKVMNIGEILDKSCTIEDINKIRIDYSDEFNDHGIKDRDELNNIISQLSSVKVKECNIDKYANLGDSYYSIAISTNENGYCEEIQIYDTNYIGIFDMRTHTSKTYIVVNNNIKESYLYKLLKNYT